MTRCQREMSRARSRPRARLDARARCRCRERPCRRRWTGGNRRTSSSRSRPPPGPPRERRHRGRAAGRAESSSLTPAHGHDVACEELIELPATHWLRDCRKRARRRDPVVVGHQVGHLFGHASTVSPDPGTGCNFTTPTATKRPAGDKPLWSMHPPHEGHGARETRDVLWTYHSAELFQLLVLQRAGRRVVTATRPAAHGRTSTV